MKKHARVADVFKKGKRHLSPEWKQAFADAHKSTTPWRDLDSTRPERARAAYAAICLAGTDRQEGVKKHPKMKKFRIELQRAGHLK